MPNKIHKSDIPEWSRSKQILAECLGTSIDILAIRITNGFGYDYSQFLIPWNSQSWGGGCLVQLWLGGLQILGGLTGFKFCLVFLQAGLELKIVLGLVGGGRILHERVVLGLGLSSKQNCLCIKSEHFWGMEIHGEMESAFKGNGNIENKWTRRVEHTRKTNGHLDVCSIPFDN